VKFLTIIDHSIHELHPCAASETIRLQSKNMKRRIAILVNSISKIWIQSNYLKCQTYKIHQTEYIKSETILAENILHHI